MSFRAPPEVTGLAARVYTGPVGSSTTSNATTTEIESVFYFVTTETLRAREGMTISMAWAPGVIARSTTYVRTVRFFRSKVEKKWARAFEDLYKESPDWYSGPYGHRFRPTIFVTNLGGMSHQVGSAMTSQPRSGGGSGFSGGGGSSGGGFGGGGGGGF